MPFASCSQQSSASLIARMRGRFYWWSRIFLSSSFANFRYYYKSTSNLQSLRSRDFGRPPHNAHCCSRNVPASTT